MKNNPYEAFKVKEFRLFIIARFFFTVGFNMQGVIIGWQIKQITNSVIHLGLIGLAEALPFIITSFFAGHIADIISRKRIILIANSFLVLSLLTLVYIAFNVQYVMGNYGVLPIYLVIGFSGVIRAFLSAAVNPFLSQLVPRSLYTNASTWNSTIWHTGYIMGNALGGLLCAISVTFAFSANAAIIFVALLFFMLIGSKPIPIREKKEQLTESLSAGLRFVFGNKIILGALSLDLFAVLFGGATALLPVFATDILKVSAIGFGFLRAAPAIGAVVMAIVMVYTPLKKDSGKKMLLAVAGFGICTILFALSENYYLSLLLLALMGALDNVSVVVRQTILQLIPPDSMRGRVSAVNSMFVGSSNEIGAFESGLAAQLMGVVPSVVLGGILTLVVVGITAKFAPQLRRLNMEDLA